MVPALIRYTDDMPQWMGGYAKWFYIAIRPKYKDDRGIHAHELEHVKQWWLTTILAAAIIGAICYRTGYSYAYMGLSLVVYQLLYATIPAVKLHCEVDAYKQQLKHYADDRTARFAKFIAEKYGLKITAEEAEQLLRKP
jgi:hypothetical protein